MKLPLILLTILNMHAITRLRDNNNHSPLIEQTCTNTPNDQLCLSTLRASPYSSNTDTIEGLCLILVDAIKSEAEAALSSVDELKRHRPELRAELEQCRNTYKAVINGDVPEAVAGLVKGVPKFSEEGMRDAAWEAEICESGFDDLVIESPLSGNNKDLHDLALVTAHIIRNLL